VAEVVVVRLLEADETGMDSSNQDLTATILHQGLEILGFVQVRLPVATPDLAQEDPLR
jgi:hypothetical protein